MQGGQTGPTTEQTADWVILFLRLPSQKNQKPRKSGAKSRVKWHGLSEKIRQIKPVIQLLQKIPKCCSTNYSQTFQAAFVTC